MADADKPQPSWRDKIGRSVANAIGLGPTLADLSGKQQPAAQASPATITPKNMNYLKEDDGKK